MDSSPALFLQGWQCNVFGKLIFSMAIHELTTLKVHETLFKVHRFFFDRDSSYFRDCFRAADEHSSSVEMDDLKQEDTERDRKCLDEPQVAEEGGEEANEDEEEEEEEESYLGMGTDDDPILLNEADLTAKDFEDFLQILYPSCVTITPLLRQEFTE